MQIWYGRPSGHSSYYSIVATFESEAETKKVASKLRDALENKTLWEECDWEPNDAALTADGRKLSFSVYTAGYLEAVDEIIRASSPQKVEEYEDMQELQITFSFDSPNVTLGDIKLLLLIQHPDLEYLLSHSEGRVERDESSGITKGILHYVGDYAYDGDNELLGHPTSELGCTVTVLDE